MARLADDGGPSYCLCGIPRLTNSQNDEMTVALMTDFDSSEPSDAIPQAMAMLDSLREELARQQAKA